MPIAIVVGLPHLSAGPILSRALALRCPLLVSANALSRWAMRRGVREWAGWRLAPLANLPERADCMLDSGGFTAHVTYRGFPWTIAQYLDLAAAYPFRLFASLDYPAEHEIAGDRAAVRERISRTIAANRETRRQAEDRGLEDRLMPVLQGRTPEDFERCADALAWSIVPGRTIGVGSMCRRQTRGPDGLVAVLEHLDRVLPARVRLHAFGVKGDALPYLRHLEHRVVSIDSQAYGVAARRDAHRRGVPKTDRVVARHMTRWVEAQTRAATARGQRLPPFAVPTPDPIITVPRESAIARARQEINDLIESGDLDHDDIVESWIEAWAADLPLEEHD
ncbi:MULTISPECIES: hypothetical protein [unclassified Sphingomonas]|uniref:deazapurine DNA modification protein DpdA family protein n=1 Tax=unclassified Sphingomonas TaxID=196159 RepID=UPI00092C4919|nr:MULTISPECIES: hypothetical protein [unclassified Sphingomonas]MBN8847378.1 hypothetical protein [Sphingomonas sp.]OJV28213.1 MAG: hypothetical protein BGO24_07730 [Sphingomonas sp. 67-36]